MYGRYSSSRLISNFSFKNKIMMTYQKVVAPLMVVAAIVGGGGAAYASMVKADTNATTSGVVQTPTATVSTGINAVVDTPEAGDTPDTNEKGSVHGHRPLEGDGDGDEGTDSDTGPESSDN